jgi:septum formation protein
MGLSFRVIVPHADEHARERETPADYALRTAIDKAYWVCRHELSGPGPTGRIVIIAADTVVTIDGLILGKPAGEDRAREMLRRLSGRRHQVLSGLCVLERDGAGEERERHTLVRTTVAMKALSDEEIGDYIVTGEPMDKAGAYAIQGRAAYMIRAVQGSYTNVVGLPLAELSDLLRR